MNRASDGPNELAGTPPVLPRAAVQRWRLVLARDPITAESAQRGQQAAWEAALAGAGLPVAGLDAPKPRPRWALAAPLATAIPGEAELLDLWLIERLPAWRVREALVPVIPPGWRLVELHDAWLGEPALPGRVAASVYRAMLEPGVVPADALRTAAGELLAAGSLPRERRKGEQAVAYDLRPLLGALDVEEAADGSAIVRMTLRHDPERGVGRPEEAMAALGDRLGITLEPAGLARERLVLADPAPPTPPEPRRRAGPPVPRAGSRRGAPG